jgi:hypothetical protein
MSYLQCRMSIFRAMLSGSKHPRTMATAWDWVLLNTARIMSAPNPGMV